MNWPLIIVIAAALLGLVWLVFLLTKQPLGNVRCTNCGCDLSQPNWIHGIDDHWCADCAPKRALLARRNEEEA